MKHGSRRVCVSDPVFPSLEIGRNDQGRIQWVPCRGRLQFSDDDHFRPESAFVSKGACRTSAESTRDARQALSIRSPYLFNLRQAEGDSDERGHMFCILRLARTRRNGP